MWNVFCGVWETPPYKDCGCSQGKKEHTYTPGPPAADASSGPDICQGVWQPESIYPSIKCSERRGRAGESLSQKEGKKDWKKACMESVWASVMPSVSTGMKWVENKGECGKCCFFSFLFWSAAGCVKSITSTSWLLKNEIKLVLFSGPFSCERRDPICWRRHKLTINTSPSLFSMSTLYLPPLRHSFSSFSPRLCPVIKTHVHFNGVNVFRVEAEFKIVNKEMFPLLDI